MYIFIYSCIYHENSVPRYQHHRHHHCHDDDQQQQPLINEIDEQ